MCFFQFSLEMGTLTSASIIPSKLKTSSFTLENPSFLHQRTRRSAKTNQSIAPVARLIGPAIFEASKLKVLFLGVDQEEKHPLKLPRTYTLTHSDITSKLTLTISHTINNSQLEGWYNKFQRDEVVAEWKKTEGEMSLHVHCHISGGHFLLDLCAGLRYFIFSKELPMVLKAFVHGDKNLFKNYPQLEDALVWVYFHSNRPRFNKVECWGPLKDCGPLLVGPTKTTILDISSAQTSLEKSTCSPPINSITGAQNPSGNIDDDTSKNRLF